MLDISSDMTFEGAANLAKFWFSHPQIAHDVIVRWTPDEIIMIKFFVKDNILYNFKIW